ncbi:glycosyltransferase [Chloroflexota bacterium]
MRIAILSYHTCPLATLGGKNTGGMNVYIRDLTRQLGKFGLHVDIYTRSESEHMPHIVHDLGYGNRVVHVPAGPEIPLPKAELAKHISSFSDYVINFSDKKNLRYDLIHSHYWMSGIAARVLNLAWDVPIIHMFHTLGLMKNRIAGQGEYEGDYRIRGELEVLRVVDKIIASTPAELAQLQWLYEVQTDHVSIIPPGVDIRHFYPIPKDEARDYIGLPLDVKLLLTVGRIEPLKGIDILLRAVAKLHDSRNIEKQNICLAIIGGDASVSDGEMSHEMARLQRIKADLDLHETVYFLGKQPQDKLPYYYSAADIMVMPSHYESFGMVALEAMACGTPVVASQVGGLAYLIQDGLTGFHVPDRDPEVLKKRLTAILDNEDLQKSMSSNAVGYAKNYSWEIVARQVIDLYEELIESKS